MSEGTDVTVSRPRLPYAIRLAGNPAGSIANAMTQAYDQGYGVVLITDRWASIQQTNAALSGAKRTHRSLNVEAPEDLVRHRAWLEAAWRAGPTRGVMSILLWQGSGHGGAPMLCEALSAATEAMTVEASGNRDNRTLVICDAKAPAHHIDQYVDLIGNILLQTDASLLVVDRHMQLDRVLLPRFNADQLAPLGQPSRSSAAACAAAVFHRLGVGVSKGPPNSFWRGRAAVAATAQSAQRQPA